MVSRKPRPRKLPTIEDVDGVVPLQTWIQPKPRNILALPVTSSAVLMNSIPNNSTGGATNTLTQSYSAKALSTSPTQLGLPRRSSIADTTTSPSRGGVTVGQLSGSPSRQPLPLPMSSDKSAPANQLQGRNETVVINLNRGQPRNLNCEICLSLASYSSDVLQCIYCNVVCHAKCLQRFQSNLLYPQRNWVCFLCVDELDASRSHFEGKRQAQIDFQLKSAAQVIIAKYFRGYSARKFYIRIYTIIVRLQIMFNIRRRKRAFMFNTQAKLRPMKLFIVKCTGLVICDREAFKGMMAASHNSQSNIEISSTVQEVPGMRLSTEAINHHSQSISHGHRRSSSSSSEAHEDKFHHEIENDHGDEDDTMSIQSIQSTETTGSQLGGKKSSKHLKNGGKPSKKSNLKKKEYEVYVLVTVIDQSRGEMIQSWRLLSSIKKLTLYPNSTFDITFEESVMLGGVSGFNTIVLSCFQKGVARDIFLGQVAIDLSENYIWRKGGFFQAMPLTKAEYELRDNIGMEMKADYRSPPRGSITFELTAYRGMSSECGYCNATSAEDIIRAIGKGSSEYPGYVNALVNTVHIGGLTNSHGTSHGTSHVSDSDKAPDTHHSSPNHGHSHGHGHVKVKYGTMLPLSTPFQDTHGNPMKKAWLAIAEGFVFVYSHFGDQLKLVVDLSQFMYSFHFKGKSMVIYQLSRPTYPPFIFFPMEVSEMLRWKCAFLSSIHAIKAKDSSVGNGSHGSGSINDKFDVNYLINDLLAMDQLKPRKAGKNGQFEPLTAHPLMKTLPSDNLAIPTHALLAPPTAESMLASHSGNVGSGNSGSGPVSGMGMGGASSKRVSASTTTANTPSHKNQLHNLRTPTASGKTKSTDIEEDYSIAKVSSSSAHKSLLTYKPKDSKIDLSKSMTVAIPEFNFSPDLKSNTTKNKVLAAIFHGHPTSSHSRSIDPTGSDDGENFMKPDLASASGESSNNLADMIKESFDLDDVVTNPKYQQYGEQFVSKLMTGAMADQFIKPLRTPTSRKSFMASGDAGNNNKYSKGITPKYRRSFLAGDPSQGNLNDQPATNQSNAILNALISSNFVNPNNVVGKK